MVSWLQLRRLFYTLFENLSTGFRTRLSINNGCERCDTCYGTHDCKLKYSPGFRRLPIFTGSSTILAFTKYSVYVEIYVYSHIPRASSWDSSVVSFLSLFGMIFILLV